MVKVGKEVPKIQELLHLQIFKYKACLNALKAKQYFKIFFNSDFNNQYDIKFEIGPNGVRSNSRILLAGKY